MANDVINLNPGSGGDATDAESVTGGGTGGATTVKRERVQVAGATIGEVARVKAGPAATSDAGLVVVPSEGIVSAGNSTQGAALLAGATFTGAWEEVTQYGEITYAVNGAPAGAPGTVQFQFHFGLGAGFTQPLVGSAPDVTAGALPVSGVGQVAPHTLVPVAKWFRIVYVNGATNLTEFRLQTLYHVSRGKNLTRFPVQSITDYDDVDDVRAMLQGRYGTVTPATPGVVSYPNVPVNLLGYLSVVSEEFIRDVSLGRVPGHKTEQIIGRNPTVGTTFEDVWQNSGVHTYPAAAAVASLVSSSVLDTLAGTGVQTVRVYGLSAAFVEQNEVVNMNGIIAAATVNTYIRVQKIVVESVGTGGSAAGTITCSVGGNEQSRIAVGDNQSLDTFYTVPDGKTAILVEFSASVGAGDDVRFRLQSRKTGAGMPFITTENLRLYQTIYAQKSEAVLTIPARTDVRWQAQAAGGTIVADVSYDLLVVDSNLVV